MKPWPKLKRDYKGLRVRAACTIRNQGGQEVRKGTHGIVEGYVGGPFGKGCKVQFGGEKRVYITNVGERELELL